MTEIVSLRAQALVLGANEALRVTKRHRALSGGEPVVRRVAPTTGAVPRRPRRGRTVLLLGMLVVTGLAVAVFGAMSTFTQARSKSQSVSTGTFVFNLNDPASGAVFSTAISGIAPGDFADRLVDLANTGSIHYASVSLALAATTSSLLDSDATNGLQLQVDVCSTTWTQASSSVVATCSGTATVLTVLTPIATAISSGPTYSSNLTSLSSGTDHLRFHYYLPTASTGTAGLTSVLNDTFTATQATGGAYH